MSIKSAILTLINTKLSSGSAISASEHREVEVSLLDNLYPIEVNETHATTNVITERNLVNTNLQYDVKIYKQGRTVFINGFIKNNSAFAVNDYFLTIVGTEYLPALVTYSGNKYIANSNLPSTSLSLNTTNNRLNAVVPANTTVIFSISYPTLN